MCSSRNCSKIDDIQMKGWFRPLSLSFQTEQESIYIQLFINVDVVVVLIFNKFI